MASFSDLESFHFYLIREKQNEDLQLVQAVMKTKKCVLVKYFKADTIFKSDNIFLWKKKSDLINEITEQLSEEEMNAFLAITQIDEDDDEDFDWDDDDDDDDDLLAWEEDDEEDEEEGHTNNGNGNNLRPVK